MSQQPSKSAIPYLMLVFFNTFIDIGHKVLLQDTLYQTTTSSQYSVYSAIINALILLPYILLFTPSGFIADRFSKAKVLQITAFITFPLTLLICFCYFRGYFWIAYALTFFLAVQSVLNSPAKYGYIKEIFGKEQLSTMNAIVQTLTIIAILGATFAFTALFSHYMNAAGLEHSQDKSLIMKSFAPAGFLLVLFSSLEALMTLFLTKKAPADPYSTYHSQDYFKGKYLKTYIENIYHPKIILNCILGLSVFWALNQVLLASYGSYLKEHVGNISVLFAQGSLAMGGIGILFGALYAGKKSKSFIETGLIPVASIGIAVGLLILPYTSSKASILSLFLAYGFFGGMLIVPLNALIQFYAPKQKLGKILAANNFIQNCFMFGFLAITVILASLKIDSRFLINGLFVIALIGAINSLLTMRHSLTRYLLYIVTSRFYKTYVHGLKNIPSSKGVLMLGNHVSFIDWAILQIACPRPIRFVMERQIYEKKHLKWIFKFFNVIPISKGAAQESLALINQALNDGEVVALFPEGRLSKNGQMGYFHTGFERAAKDADAQIIPFYLHGLWGSRNSYASRQQSTKYKEKNRRIHIVFGKPLDIHSDAITVRQKVRELSITAWKKSIEQMHTLQKEWLYQAKKWSNHTAIIDDNDRRFSFNQVLSISLYLKKRLKKIIGKNQRVGLIMPTCSAGVFSNMAILASGKTLVNLNYTSSEQALLSTIKDSGIQHIISSKTFLKKLKAKGIDTDKLENQATFIFIEDLFQQKSKKVIVLLSVITRILPFWLLNLLFVQSASSKDTAAILFSSGSEGKPKGIELTHGNILSNVQQISSVVGIKSHDKIMNSLPLFHGFGLTVTTLLPMLKGIPMICQPDPTKAHALAKQIYKHQATIYCSTSSLLGLMCKNKRIHPQMLKSLRLIIAGAEKLSDKVRQDFKESFGLEIYEGYGATEVAPVASCNLPDVISKEDWHIHQANKLGTVGLPLPGCAFKVVHPETLKEVPVGEDGLILIGGTQVMKGYLNAPEKTSEVMIHDKDYSWYKTGDKGHLDEDGFLTIVDRFSRFAKIAGEMVSLSYAEQVWQQGIEESEIEVMALALKDDRKGEKLALLYAGTIDEEILKQSIVNLPIPRMMLPDHILKVEELPKLGSGKRDYVTAKKILLADEENPKAV